MKTGFILPFGDARTASVYAAEAEKVGWDGFFVWESLWGVDAWISLSAAAMRTERIKLGTMISPLSRMRPWKIASETTTLDRMSNGRLILSVGLGATDTGFEAFKEETDRKTRAELLDESLNILTGLWSGKPVKHIGKHYQVDTSMLPEGFTNPPLPIQKPRIPIWVVGAWFKEKSIERVLKYDGFIPNFIGSDGKMEFGLPKPEQILEASVYFQKKRKSDQPMDIIIEGQTPGDDRMKAREILAPYKDAGATWWLESMWAEKDPQAVLQRIYQGPPK